MSDLSDFKKRAATFKVTLDKDVAEFSARMLEHTSKEYGPEAALELGTFFDVLSRGGKRMRGGLVLLGYEMSGGKDQAVALQAARATEMFQTYLLILDDIQDNSLTRRGGPSAHVALADYHRKHKLGGNAEHFGISVAINAACAGMHMAMTQLANLDCDPVLKANVVSITNRTLMVTSHGQTMDFMNELRDQISVAQVEKTMENKTAHYTVLNPLHTGMVLAGADCHATDAITPYALATGKGFQILNDVTGVFSAESETGKTAMDDIREGKRTYMMAYALENAADADVKFLLSCLGNQKLTQANFEKCQAILESSGAKAAALKQARTYFESARSSLTSEAHRWPGKEVAFLRDLTHYLASQS